MEMDNLYNSTLFCRAAYNYSRSWVLYHGVIHKSQGVDYQHICDLQHPGFMNTIVYIIAIVFHNE